MTSVRVLLVEDSPSDAALFQAQLDSPEREFEVEWVPTFAEGCARVTSADCTLLDLTLPDAHGLDAVVDLTQMAPDMPVIVLTGAAELDLEALHADILTGTAAVRSAFPSMITGELHGAVRTYPTVVREVMVELISNAARFGASDGDQVAHITVGVAIENSVLHLTVSDLGSGMTDDAMERAPQLFQRLHRRTCSDEDSVGAGLALVRRKIERCGGELRLSRPELHDGLVADVALPIPVIDLRSPAQAELQVAS
jgi:signal transduction histidine kinase